LPFAIAAERRVEHELRDADLLALALDLRPRDLREVRDRRIHAKPLSCSVTETIAQMLSGVTGISSTAIGV
jgi:hypothetical protein